MDNKERNEELEEFLTEENENSDSVGIENLMEDEEIVVELSDETLEEVKEKKVLGVGGKLVASIIDQIVVAAISLIGMFIFDLVIRLIGFYVAERLPMYLIFFAIGNVFYPLLCDFLKLKKTYGLKVMGAE